MGFTTLSILLYPILGACFGLLLNVRTAIAAAVLFGMLFLPPIEYDVPGPIPTIDKNGVIGLAAFLIVLARGFGQLMSVRWGLIDVPVLIFTLAPPISSIVNNYGVYDAGSQFIEQVMRWTIPYVVGRAVFSTPGAMTDLAKGALLAVFVYTPLIVLEMFISPQLQRLVFGIQTFKGSTMWRLGGWRPVVFFPHGISLGLFLAMASVAALWLFDRRVGSRQISGAFAGGILLLTLLSRALGGFALLLVAVASLVPIRISGMRIGLVCLVLLAPGYTLARVFSLVPTGPAISLVERIDAGRAVSLSVRLEHEENLRARALERPGFGWGPHGMNRGATELERRRAITDSYWIIVMGRYGLIGLVSGMATLSLGALVFAWRAPRELLMSPAAAGAVIGACFVSMYSADLLMNGFLMPIAHVMAGGMAGLAVLRMPAPKAAVVGRERRRVPAMDSGGVGR